MSTPHSYGWAKLPTTWVRRANGLATFTNIALGPSVAALKLLFAIVGSQHLQRRAGAITSGAKLSYDELGSMTGLARGMISPALSLLDPVLEVHRGEGRSTNRYRIKSVDEPGTWAKFPAEFVFKNNIIPLFSPRSRVDLAALKFYYLILAFRRNESGFANLSYAKAEEYGLASRQTVSRAKSKLIEVGLITVYSAQELSIADDPFAERRRVYFPLGLGRPRISHLQTRPSLRLLDERKADFR